MTGLSSLGKQSRSGEKFPWMLLDPITKNDRLFRNAREVKSTFNRVLSALTY